MISSPTATMIGESLLSSIPIISQSTSRFLAPAINLFQI
jgi:hypothetical protein